MKTRRTLHVTRRAANQFGRAALALNLQPGRLARRHGVTPATVEGWKWGHTTPRRSTSGGRLFWDLVVFADALDVLGRGAWVVVHAIAHGRRDRDEIAARSGLPTGEAHAVVSALICCGLVHGPTLSIRTPGGTRV